MPADLLLEWATGVPHRTSALSHDEIRRHQASVEMKTLFSSVLWTRPSIPSSLPTPDCL